MMSDADMAKLRETKGAAFDRMFLQMMIKHHEGAIEMAGTEIEKGAHGGAKEVAQAIIDGQQAEIDTMNRLLGES